MSRCRFGLFELDTRTGELRREGELVKLAPQPARVLALLVSRPGDVVLRDELRKEIWGEDTFVDFERSLNFCILQVRTALGDSSDNPRFIQTVPRRGYRFIAPVATPAPPPPSVAAPSLLVAPAVADSTLPATGPIVSPSESSRRAGVKLVWPIAVACVVAILLPSAWMVWGERLRGAGANAPASTRIAVLPFANLTGDTSADYLADGLTDELISQLGALGGSRLAVIARTSAMTYRRTPKTITAIGAELDVRYVVEGSVRREGGVLRVAGRLVPVNDQTAVAQWDESFDSRPASTGTQQTHAAIRIARLVALKLMPPADVSSPHTTTNQAAWDAFLQASALMDRGTANDVRRAVAQLQSAVARDPEFAAAWATLAQAQHLLVMMGAERPTDAYPAAQDAADRAQQLDASLAAAWLAQGLVQLWYQWRPADAAAAFERALALNASSAAAHHDYAWALVALGRTEEAIRHITLARDLDPLSTRANNDVGWLHLHLRQPAEAARACRHTLAIDGASLEAQACLERAYAERQQFDAALLAARAVSPAAAAVDSTAGDAAETLRRLWRRRVEKLEEIARTRWVSSHTLAVHYALIGEKHKAIAALEMAFAERSGMMVFLARDPAMDPLRDEPRFTSLLRHVGAR